MVIFHSYVNVYQRVVLPRPSGNIMGNGWLNLAKTIWWFDVIPRDSMVITFHYHHGREFHKKNPTKRRWLVCWGNLPMEFSRKMMTPEKTSGSSHQCHGNSPWIHHLLMVTATCCSQNDPLFSHGVLEKWWISWAIPVIFIRLLRHLQLLCCLLTPCLARGDIRGYPDFDKDSDETYGYGSKLGTPKLWMVNTKLDIHICGPINGLPFWWNIYLTLFNPIWATSNSPTYFSWLYAYDILAINHSVY